MQRLASPWQWVAVVLMAGMACRSGRGVPTAQESQPLPGLSVLVVGVAQDGGYPQAGCRKSCCEAVGRGEASRRQVSGLALLDPASGAYWLFDATPDIGGQMRMVEDRLTRTSLLPSGIFLTHAHMGHYTGLMYLGREAMGAKAVPVHAMPRMRAFLEGNGPWGQLVSLGNIALRTLRADSVVDLGNGVRVTPFRVPHRDEYSETVGYRIEGPSKRILYIPDIDKWSRWDRDIRRLLSDCDMAFLDATFFVGEELPGRDMREIPHPSVTESMELFAQMPDSLRRKVCFIHFNHTNPLLRRGSEAWRRVRSGGYGVAEEGMVVGL